MSRITFFTCEENDTSNQVPRIMFFDVWAITRWFSFRLSLFKSLASVEVNFLLSLKTRVRKDLLPTILRLRIMWKASKAKTQKRRQSVMWNCWKNFGETKRTTSENWRSAHNVASRIKQVSCGVYSLCRRKDQRRLWALKLKMSC